MTRPGAAKGRSSSASRIVLQEEEVEGEDGRKSELVADGAAGSSLKKRAPNFEPAEDVIIARCWKNMTNDAKTGTDQTSDVFWQRLFLKFTTVMTEEKKRTQTEVNEHRSWKTLLSRWRRCIQKETMLFASIYRRVRAQEKSGWNDDDYEKEAMNRYRAMNGRNKEFAYLDCWKVLRDEPKFMLMIKATPNDEDIPAIIMTENENVSAAGDTEGDASAVTLVTEPVRTSNGSGSYSSINGPPIGPNGRPIGVKKTKAGLKEALSVATQQRDIATERHNEVAELLTRIGDRMNQLANRVDIQSSFLGSFVFLQMGETEKAHALADSGRNVLVVSNVKKRMKDGAEVDDDVEEVEIEEDNDDDDREGNDGVENEKENRNENKNENKKKELGKKRKKIGYDVSNNQKGKEIGATAAIFGYCAAGRRCGRFAETGGRLDRFNFSPNAGEEVEEIIENPKHRCTGCCRAFCGGTCGIGESADDYICNDCLSMP